MKGIRTTIVVGAVVVGGLVAAPAAQAAHPFDSTPCTKRLITAHEGYTLNADGDTVESQEAAFDIGANIADSDLWVTKDGYIVEMHDNDVSHSTNGTGLVTEMTLAQVLALRTKYHNDPIPQLNDSLAIPTASEDNRYLQFEAKFSFGKPANQQLLVNEITAAGMTAHVIIYTAYLDMAHQIKALDPDLTVWYKPQNLPDVSQVLGLDGVMLPAALITKKVVNTFHTNGLSVIRQRVAVETPQNWNHFVKTGADGLMTDSAPMLVDECRALP